MPRGRGPGNSRVPRELAIRVPKVTQRKAGRYYTSRRVNVTVAGFGSIPGTGTCAGVHRGVVKNEELAGNCIRGIARKELGETRRLLILERRSIFEEL